MLAIALFFFFQAEDGIRDADVTGVQTCALPIFKNRTTTQCYYASRLLIFYPYLPTYLQNDRYKYQRERNLKRLIPLGCLESPIQTDSLKHEVLGVYRKPETAVERT